jgi:hypothetical protein
MMQTPEQIAAIRAEFAAIDRAIHQILVDHAALFAAVQQQVTPLWERVTAGKTFARKPSYCLRLLSEGAALLVGISPAYSRQTKTVHCANLLVESLGEVERYLDSEDPKPLYQLYRHVQVRVEAGKLPRCGAKRRTAVQDIQALLPTLEQFLADPGAVLRRSTRFCGICGRLLTDGQSRARGIGPECLKSALPLVAFETSPFARMESLP